MVKNSLKRRLISLLLCALMLVTPLAFASCESGENGKDGADGAMWYRGTASIETVTDGKAGDFYIDTDDYKLYQKNADGSWTLVMENFGKPGDKGETGKTEKTYTFVRYAKDASGTDISTDPTGRNYISILTTAKENPEASDFTVWIKFVGEDGTPGEPGEPGASSYTYIAFAKDASGNGFSQTHTAGLDYIGIMTTNTEITDLTKNDFEGKWIKFVGDDGENGLTPYIGYDGYWWTGTEKGQQKFVEVLTERTVENTVGLIGNEYFDSYTVDMGQSKVALMSNYFTTIKKTVYSGLTLGEIQLYAETAGTLTVSTAKTKDISDRTAGDSVALNVIKQFTLTAGLNVLNLTGVTVPHGETIVLGNTGDTAKLVAYQGINQNDEQGLFTVLNETGIYKQTDGVNDKLVIKVELPAYVEAIQGLKETIDTIGSSGSGWKSVKLPGPYTHANLTAYAGKTISHIDVRAYEHKAETPDNVFMTVRVVKQSNAALVSTHKFYADPDDITGTTLGKVITLTCDDEITVGYDETLVFGGVDDTLLWSYITNLPSTPVTGGFRTGTSVGSSIGTLDENSKVNMLAVNVYLSVPTVSEALKQLEGEEKMEVAIPELKMLLTGKKVSVMGDSISTFEGVSNNGNANSTIANNRVYYSGTNGVTLNDTWWMQTINNYGMTLNVNNSYSGSWVTDQRVDNVAGCNTRAENLHTNSGVKPDIIAVFIGTNDLGGGSPGPRACGTTFDNAFFTRVESGKYTSSYTSGSYTIPTYFDEGYALMISKMKKEYPDADIFCFTLPEASNGREGELLDKYNAAIKAIAEHYGCSVVDLYATELSTNRAQYTIDNLHPNVSGMDIITREFTEALVKKYLP